jgi:hypothetical protein
MKKLLNALSTMCIFAIVITFIFGSAVPAYAATNEPYGFTYDDTESGKTIYRFYSYSKSEQTYVPSRNFYSRDTYVYNSNGTLICNTSAGSGSKYNGFDINGQFYMIGSTGSLTVISTSNETKVLIESGVLRLNYNSDDIAVSVATNSGNLYLDTLTPAPEVDNNDDYNPVTVTQPANRVDIYTNSANELVYEAYKKGKLKTQIVVSKSGSNVLNATDKVRLSDSLKGAKFLGFDSSYNVYLYETDALYRFTSGNWYSAEKLCLDGSYKSFKKDDNGFISKVTTSNNSYTIKQLTTSSKWKATKTYAVSKSGYVTLYTKGSKKSNTLTLKSGTLKLNGTKVATGVGKYGFINAKTFIYSKGKTYYTASISNPKKATKLLSNGKGLSTNSIGLVRKVITSKGSKKVS